MQNGGSGSRGENLVPEQVCCMPGFIGKVEHFSNFYYDGYNSNERLST